MEAWVVPGKVTASWSRVPALLCVLVAPTCTLRAASPVLDQILPRGVTRGSDSTLTLNGARLADAVDLLCYDGGFTFVKFDAAQPNQLKAVVKVSGDCRLGEHALRVRTRSGISDLRTLFVGALPGLDEVEPNGDFAKPQKVALNVTITGVVENEDVDYYAFEAKKGQRVAAEVEGMRLADGVFDPYVAILNSARFELAACDDSALLQQDPVASALIPEDGTYVAMVRECAYGGSDGSVYRLHLGTFPRPLAVLPSGGKGGDEVEVTFLGDVAGEVRQKFALPAAAPPRYGLFAQDAGGVAPSQNLLRISPFGNVIEVEPNDTKEQATPAALPNALGGIISRPGDVDFFRVPCKKGQVLDVQVYARRLRSPLDSVLAILDPSGNVLASNDDAIGPDSYLRFTAPEDKDYLVSMTDHLGKGGPCHVYRVELTPVQPQVILSIPRVAQFSQERQTIVVPRGNRYATLVSASRLDFGGDLVVGFDKLPQGVSVQAENMTAGATLVPVIFEAAPDAQVSGGFLEPVAKPVDASQAVSSSFSQDVELVVGGPGQSVYWKHEVDRLAVAVAEEVPFKLRIVEPRVPLLQNGSMGLKVVAERALGFNAPIQLQMIFQPPGIGAAGGIAIPEGQAEAVIPINAGGGAPAKAWKIVVSGTSDAGAGPVWVASQFATLQVASPFFTLQPDRGSIEQGKETQILCKVEHQAPFDGVARVDLLGLPPKVSSPAVEVTKDTPEFAIKLSADPQSPPGQHKGLFCRVQLVQNGETIVYSSGGTELRIDPPPPPRPSEQPKPQAPPPEEKVAEKKAEEPKAPPQKPLSRLEKLRLEAKDRAAGETKEDEK